MNKRKLGKTGFEVTPFAFGGNVFGWTIDASTSYRLLDAFVAGGGNLVDTADIYSSWAPDNKGGESEIIIGEWLKKSGKRAQVLIATKVGMEVFGKKGLSKQHIMESVEGSLKRLQTDYIDLYQSHRDDPETPFEETLGAYALLLKQGKIRAIGASNITASRLKEARQVSLACGLPEYQTLQPLYNLIDRNEFEGDLQNCCVENGIGVIPYYSLASGFLSGKYRSKMDLGKGPRASRVEGYLNDRGLRILAAVDQVAAAKKATPAQVSLAWVMSRPSVTAPIASATKLEQLQDLLKSLTLELDRDSIAALDAASL